MRKALLTLGMVAHCVMGSSAIGATCSGPLINGPVNLYVSDANVSIRGKSDSDRMKDGAFLVSTEPLAREFANISDASHTRIIHRASSIVCNEPVVAFTTKPSAITPFSPAAVSGCIVKASGIQADLFIAANDRHISQIDGYAAMRNWTLTSIKSAHEQNIWTLLNETPRIELAGHTLKLLDTTSTYEQYIYSRVEVTPSWIIIGRSYGMLCQHELVEDAADRVLARALLDTRG